jgi:Zn-finger nucleic acid-binding protein
MKCPKCDNELARVGMEDIEVDQCPRCGGIWFDFGELKQVLPRDSAKRLLTRLKTGRKDDAKKGPCPRCGGKGPMILVKHPKHDLHIDTCKVCYGQWLDGGELEILREKGVFETVAGFFKQLIG